MRLNKTHQLKKTHRLKTRTNKKVMIPDDVMISVLRTLSNYDSPYCIPVETTSTRSNM